MPVLDDSEQLLECLVPDQFVNLVELEVGFEQLFSGFAEPLLQASHFLAEELLQLPVSVKLPFLHHLPELVEYHLHLRPFDLLLLCQKAQYRLLLLLLGSQVSDLLLQLLSDL